MRVLSGFNGGLLIILVIQGDRFILELFESIFRDIIVVNYYYKFERQIFIIFNL